MPSNIGRFTTILLFTAICLSINIHAQQTDIIGPTGSDSFGEQVVVLPNGNIVVTDFLYDIPAGAANVGAVYLYNGSNGNLISTLTGSTANDRIGSGGVTVLTNGNFVVSSSNWDGTTTNVGAVTFVDGTTGLSGTVSSSNSLVGSTADDDVGSGEVFAYAGGIYAVKSPSFDNGGDADVGAVTYLSGLTGNFAPIGNSKLNSKYVKRGIPTSYDIAVSMTNSVIGTTPSGGTEHIVFFDLANDQLVVGRPADNIITLFKRLGVTAAEVTVAGRVSTAKGLGIPRATVSMSDSNGVIRTAQVNQFGYFKFENVEAGETYVFETQAKGYSFASQVLNIDEDIRRLEIVAN